MSLMLCSFVIMSLVSRELAVREGRVFFEFAGEYAQKKQLSPQSIDDQEDKASYLDLRAVFC